MPTVNDLWYETTKQGIFDRAVRTLAAQNRKGADLQGPRYATSHQPVRYCAIGANLKQPGITAILACRGGQSTDIRALIEGGILPPPDGGENTQYFLWSLQRAHDTAIDRHVLVERLSAFAKEWQLDTAVLAEMMPPSWCEQDDAWRAHEDRGQVVA